MFNQSSSEATGTAGSSRLANLHGRCFCDRRVVAADCHGMVATGYDIDYIQALQGLDLDGAAAVLTDVIAELAFHAAPPSK